MRYLLRETAPGSSLTIRYGLGPVEITQLLISGRVELAVLPEPFVTRALASLDELGVFDLQRAWRAATGVGMPQTVLVTVGASTRSEHERIRALLSGSVDAIVADPESAFANVGELGLGLDTVTAVSSLPRLNLRVEAGSQSRPALEAYFEVLREFDQNAIGGDLPGDEFYGFSDAR
jgi:NitT/TauT family transport system substrate-binding protein